MQSAIFEGQVKHRRMAPVLHAFRYPLYMLWLDLAELEDVFRGRWLWSVRRSAVARFRRQDHLGDPNESLDTSVRCCVQEATGRRPEGPIRLLTHLSYFGYCFNPVSFFYCYDKQGEAVQTIVAEVNNTPWGERHLYVLDGNEPSLVDESDGNFWQQEFAPKKAMHVSPFMPMNVDNRWRFTMTSRQLLVHMETSRDAEKIFDATLSLARKEITGRSLARVLVLYPLMTVKVIVAIHWQALLLWIKGAPVYQHTPTKSGVSNKSDILENRSCTPSH
jgi:DUF1365 family protein